MKLFNILLYMYLIQYIYAKILHCEITSDGDACSKFLLRDSSNNDIERKQYIDPSQYKFLQTYYINLDHRKDRKRSIEYELAVAGFPFENVKRVSAIKMETPPHGCALSHMKALELAKNSTADYILVLEDDFIFREDVKQHAYNLLQAVIHNIEFDVFMLGANAHSFNSSKLDRYIDIVKRRELHKVIEARAGTGYIIPRHYVPVLLENLKRTDNMFWRGELIYDHDRVLSPCLDMVWNPLQLFHDWKISIPTIGMQISGFSDITNDYLEPENL